MDLITSIYKSYPKKKWLKNCKKKTEKNCTSFQKQLKIKIKSVKKCNDVQSK